ncbi:related to AGC kinase YPK3 [Hanseniaspora guilliermondii]|uniref:Related to AGC kinase YPK3 n=1 Tax=Hanseniaspora guilliermondii TaxID=56406 RepID=A0A1L0FLV2_9ASCO|nr:related to AGC kinase YPK3 [Hanseniaspora guilliermondii]
MFSNSGNDFYLKKKSLTSLNTEHVEVEEFISSQQKLRALSKYSINQNTIMFGDDSDSCMNSAIEFSDENEEDSESEYIEGYKYQHKNLMSIDPKPIPEKTPDSVDTPAILINNESVSSVVAYSAFKSGGNNVSVLSISPEDNTYNVHSFTRRRSSVSKMPMSKPLSAFKVLNLDSKSDELLEIHEDMHNEDVSMMDIDDSSSIFVYDDINTEGSVLKLSSDECKINKRQKKQLVDFEPIKLLGEGAYGQVLLVKEKASNSIFAMKQMGKANILIMSDEPNEKKQSASSPKMKQVERTFSERDILTEMNHPNIVKLFYSFHDQNKLYLILQYVPGGELFFHLNKLSKFSESVASFYTLEISLAIKFLHDKGIVYRDLKPENCLLNERGHLILTDFGLSKSTTTDVLYSYCGTPEYAAPELLAPDNCGYTKSVDWYSVGCVLYDMLTSKPPYVGTNPASILQKINKDPKRLWPNFASYLSTDMKDFLSGLLNRDASLRWDVDSYWDERVLNREEIKQLKNNKKKKKKNKSISQKTSYYKQHNIFRNLSWDKLSKAEYQRESYGPIVPIITDKNLAENFDDEFTTKNIDDVISVNNVEKILDVSLEEQEKLFQGFSYEADSEFLEKYMENYRTV